MVKKLLALILAVTVMMTPTAVFAEEVKNIYDYADVIDDEFEADLEEIIDIMPPEVMGIFIMTVGDSDDIKTLADEKLNEIYHGENAFMLALDTASDEIAFSAKGLPASIDAEAIENSVNSAAEKIENGEYEEAFRVLLNSVTENLMEGNFEFEDVQEETAETQQVTEGEFVFDRADVLSYEEEAALENKIIDMQPILDGMGLIIITTDDTEGKSSEAYADDELEALWPGLDGAALLIDFENRNVWISTEGLFMRYLDDYRIESCLDAVFEYMGTEEYFLSCYAFLDSVETYINEGIPDDNVIVDDDTGEEYPYNPVPERNSLSMAEAMVAVAAGIITAGIGIIVVIRGYSIHSAEYDYSSGVNCNVAMPLSTDNLINTFVTHRIIPKSSSSSGGGRSSSGGGSRSSSHSSSSGRSHGGGGRHF